jgi:hypothetical protein
VHRHVAAAAGAGAQERSTNAYAKAVVRYQQGDVDGASRLVAGWSLSDFRASIDRFRASQISARGEVRTRPGYYVP